MRRNGFQTPMGVIKHKIALKVHISEIKFGRVFGFFPNILIAVLISWQFWLKIATCIRENQNFPLKSSVQKSVSSQRKDFFSLQDNQRVLWVCWLFIPHRGNHTRSGQKKGGSLRRHRKKRDQMDFLSADIKTKIKKGIKKGTEHFCHRIPTCRKRRICHFCSICMQKLQHFCKFY